MSITTDFKPCVPGAFKGGLSRATFFDGMVLSEADLMREQSYWRRKRKLTNRALGDGVVWGLLAEWNAKTRNFTVCPGYGLSCCGDDLVVECPETVPESSLIDKCSEDFRWLLTDRFDKCGDARPDGPVSAALLLEFAECPEDPRQTYEDPCAETKRGNCRFGAVRETVRLRLVPPPEEPVGPLDRFCRKVEELRAELTKTGVAMPTPDFDLLRPASRFGMAVVDGAATVDGTSRLASLKAGEVTETDVPQLSVGQQGKLFVEPPAGYIFTKLQVDLVDQSGAALAMGWTHAHTSADVGKGVSHAFVATVSPLFLPTSDLELTFDLGTRTNLNGVREVVLTVKTVKRLDHRSDCTRLFGGDWLEGDDPLCKVRTLALALVYGVAAGKLGSARCSHDEQLPDSEKAAREQIAWVLCWLGWQALFGLDVTDPRAGRVQACLRALFAEWCCDFAYKGPHCASTAHGVYLGGVEISPAGKILCFDPWRYRKHVLTGPLLAHWSGQFGLPSLDRIAGGLASWLCCVAGTDLTAVGAKAALTDLVMVLGKGDLAMGPAFGTGGSLAEFTKGSSFERDRAQFAGKLLGALFTRSSESIFAVASVDTVSAKGAELAIVTPSHGSQAAAAPAAAAEAVKSEVKALMRGDMPPMAAAPAIEFLANLARHIPLAAIRSDDGQLDLDPTVEAMAKGGIATTADLIAADPETVATNVRLAMVKDGLAADTVTTDRAVALVYDRVHKLLGSAGEAIAAEARGRDGDEPFTRNDLSDVVNDVRNATNPFLKKGKGTSITALREVAARTIAARG